MSVPRVWLCTIPGLQLARRMAMLETRQAAGIVERKEGLRAVVAPGRAKSRVAFEWDPFPSRTIREWAKGDLW